MSTTAWWVLGFAVGGAVVLVAALLLLVIIGLGRRIVRQTTEIVAALDGSWKNTTPLFEVRQTNLALDRIIRRLRAVREALEAP